MHCSNNLTRILKTQNVTSGTMSKQLVKVQLLNFCLKYQGRLICLTYIQNHCIHGTTASAVKRAGYTLNEIAFVLKHKNLESLKYYLDKPTLEDKTNFSDSLFDQMGQNKSDAEENSDSDFETPPKPAKMPKVYQKRKTKSKSRQRKHYWARSSSQTKRRQPTIHKSK